jgi:hypothetical protein
VFQLLEVLAMRACLKRYMKEDQICIYMFADDGITLARVKKLGWFTVTLDIIDQSDEETWLSCYTLPISLINSVNEMSIERARHRLMLEHDNAVPQMPSEAELTAFLDSLEEDDEDDEDDEGP